MIEGLSLLFLRYIVAKTFLCFASTQLKYTLKNQLKLQNQSIFNKMSTTRSQKRNNQQEVVENVSEGFVSPVIAENSCPLDQEVGVAGPSRPKSQIIEGSLLEVLGASLKEEITSEIKNLPVESQKEILRLLRPETRGNVRESAEEETDNETRNFYTPTKLVRINSTQNNDPCSTRNSICLFGIKRKSNCKFYNLQMFLEEFSHGRRNLLEKIILDGVRLVLAFFSRRFSREKSRL